MKDYTCLYRRELDISADWDCSWDIFISAYVPSQRVTRVFNKIVSAHKYWVIHNEYGFIPADLPHGAFLSVSENEADFIHDFFESKLSKHDLESGRICLDITGFMRPHMMFLIKLLIERGVRRFDVIYAEPELYAERERTSFSGTAVTTVRQITGFEGYAQNDTSNDVLIIGSGYESHLIAEVADDKEKAGRVIIFGLPSLRADMYQQNRLRVHEASDSIGEITSEKFFAPANDPFVTATVLSEIVEKHGAREPISNLYLSPLGTKAQALGFVLYYINECSARAASIIYPFSSSYSPDASVGVSRVWLFTIENL